MGKSVAADMFRHAGVPVHDSDRAVHRFYTRDAARLMGEKFPGVVREGRVDRDLLARVVMQDQSALREIERIVHPVVARDRETFVNGCRRSGSKLVVLDVPLLFEAGAEINVDVVLTVTAPYIVQKKRVLARPGMTEEKFELLLNRQHPDADKRARSHYVIDTSLGFDWVNAEIRNLIRLLAA